MRSLARMSALLLLTGCSSGDSNWALHVRSSAENPRNGQADFTSIRADVVDGRCGLFGRHCVSVRLIDETGFANNDGGRVFTYSGEPHALKAEWQSPSKLSIFCEQCDPQRIQKRLKTVNFVQVAYAD